jgi:hypothetical protein
MYYDDRLDQLPQEVKDVLKLHENDEHTYDSCSQLVDNLNKVGWTCEYYLDAEPFNLRPLFQKGKSYKYSDIEMMTEDKGLCEPQFDMHEHGRFVVGQNVIVLEHVDKDITITFVLTGTAGDDSIFECAYSNDDNL